MPVIMPQPTHLKNLLVGITDLLKILCVNQSSETTEKVNRAIGTLNEVAAVLQKQNDTRLLPLVPGGSSEHLANLLSELLSEDDVHSENAAAAALVILTGIQAYLDSAGDRVALERAWKPTILSRRLAAEYGKEAWRKAAEKAGEHLAAERPFKAQLYERAAIILKKMTKNSL